MLKPYRYATSCRAIKKRNLLILQGLNLVWISLILVPFKLLSHHFDKKLGIMFLQNYRAKARFTLRKSSMTKTHLKHVFKKHILTSFRSQNNSVDTTVHHITFYIQHSTVFYEQLRISNYIARQTSK